MFQKWSAYKRKIIQVISACLTNPFLQNIPGGNIYKGPLKHICSPGINCYSCPAASTSCPIGALQTIAGSNRFHISWYVLGFLLIIGAVLGRVVCGFLCVFGLLQELLYRIPVPKLHIPKSLDQKLRYLKYVILLLFVILLPMLLTDEFGLGDPFFCEYLCPVGTIEGGIPLLAARPALRQMAGILFSWKLALAIILILASTVIYRPFCRYFCPLGAFYALFNKISLMRLELDKESCTSCHRCEAACPMEISVLNNINSAECIRCGRCSHICPTDSIRWRENSYSLSLKGKRKRG